MAITLKKIQARYSDEITGMSMSRETGKTPNGNDMALRWVLRDKENSLVDFDKYRHDLAKRNNIKLVLDMDYFMSDYR